MYTMMYDDFTLLVMGYTGKEVMRFKLEHIEASNAMEKELMRRLSSILPPVDRSDLNPIADAKLSTFPACVPSYFPYRPAGRKLSESSKNSGCRYLLSPQIHDHGHTPVSP